MMTPIAGVLNARGAFSADARAAGASDARAHRIGDAGAILVGDLLLYAATRAVLTAPTDPEIGRRLLAQFDEAIAVSAVGEWADSAFTSTEPDLVEAFATTADKTAVYSFSAPMRAGAVLAGADAALERTLDGIGIELGLAFQLVDDLIGTFGTAQQAGRDEGADLREAKRTPLVAVARQSSAWREVADALELAHTGPLALMQARDELERSGARARIADAVRTHLDRAQAQAGDLPDGVTKLVAGMSAHILERVP